MRHDGTTEPTGNWLEFATPEAFSQPEQLFSAFLRASNVGFAILDTESIFQAINNSLAAMNGVPAAAHLGKTVRDILGKAAWQVESALEHVLVTGHAMLNLELVAKLPARREVGHWTEDYFPIRDNAGRVKQVVVFVIEVTRQKRLEQSLRGLTRKLLQTQDDERRRIARELHDSINQYHVSLQMNLGRLGRSNRAKERAELLADSAALLEECISETRIIAHLLHPPLLDEMGFGFAARLYVEGFAQRSGIRANLEISSELDRLPQAVETGLFRILQEALTNVHRHSQSSVVDIQLMSKSESDHVVLVVRDYGCGIPPEQLRSLQETGTAGGVGLASMRERVHELRGLLEIRSDNPGTVVRVTIPLSCSAQESVRPAAGERSE